MGRRVGLCYGCGFGDCYRLEYDHRQRRSTDHRAAIWQPIFNGMLKTTSLLFFIGVYEMFADAQVHYSSTFKAAEYFGAVAVWYLILTGIWSGIQYFIERRLAVSVRTPAVARASRRRGKRVAQRRSCRMRTPSDAAADRRWRRIRGRADANPRPPMPGAGSSKRSTFASRSVAKTSFEAFP